MSILGRPRNSALVTDGGIAQAGDGSNIVITGADLQVAQVAVEVRATWAGIEERYRRESLEDRSDELAAFQRFVNEYDQGWWGWAGDAWAGKTRLMAELACSPPAGCRTAAFFARRGMQDNDERGFLRNILVQLAGIIGEETLVLGIDLTAQRAQFRDLLNRSAQACAERGERLLLLVDGLDEDDVHDGDGERSIAALLPGTQSPCVVVVSSRPSPVLRIPPEHALADRNNWHLLKEVPASTVAQATARRDMRAVLTETHGLDAAALMAVTGHPMTSNLLASITGRPTGDYQDLFASSCGRCFTPVATSDPQRQAYVLAHASLYDMLLEHIEPDYDPAAADGATTTNRHGIPTPGPLRTWRGRVIAWAQTWLERRWPPNTPDYLLHEDFLTLIDGELLVAVLSDPSRHARVAARFGSPAPALGQLRAHLHGLVPAWDGQWDNPPQTDLVRSARMLFALSDLSATSGQLPAKLPAVFARVGQQERAEQLVGATVNGPSALVELATAYLESDQLPSALKSAHRAAAALALPSPSPTDTAELSRDLTRLFVRLNDLPAARGVVATIPDYEPRNTLASKVISLGMVGDADMAIGAAAQLHHADRSGSLQDAALAAHSCGHVAAAERLLAAAVTAYGADERRRFNGANLVAAWARMGRLDEARLLADQLIPQLRTEALVWLSEWCLHHEDRDQGDLIATAAMASVDNWSVHGLFVARHCSRLCAVLVRLNRYGDAAQLLQQIDQYMDNTMHGEAFVAYETVGQSELAAHHLQLALDISINNGPWFTLHTVHDLLEKLVEVDSDTWLSAIMQKVVDAAVDISPDDVPTRHIQQRIAGLLAWRGLHDASLRAFELIKTENEYQQSEVQFEYAMALASGPAWDRAASSIAPATTSTSELTDLAELLARRGHLDTAAMLAAQALAPRKPELWRTSVPADLPYALASNNQLELAMVIAQASDPYQRDEAMFAAWLAAGRHNLAQAENDLDGTASTDSSLAAAFTALAYAAVGIDDQDRTRPVDANSHAETAVIDNAIRLAERAISLQSTVLEAVSPGWIRHNVRLLAHLRQTAQSARVVRTSMPATDRPGTFAELAQIALAVGDHKGADSYATLALESIGTDLEQGQRLYFSASLAKSLGAVVRFRRTAEAAAALAWLHLPPIQEQPSTSRHGQSDNGRQVSLVIEALLVLGRVGSARNILASARSCQLDLSIFDLTPVLAVYDSAQAALDFIDSTSPHNRIQPLGRAFTQLLAHQKLGSALSVMETIEDATTKAEMHLQLATYFAETGRPAQSRDSVDKALEYVATNPQYRQDEFWTWAAECLLILGDRQAALIHLRAAISAFVSGRGHGGGLVERLASLATELGLPSIPRHLIAASWLQAGHPLGHWDLLFQVDKMQATAIAKARWG